MTADVSEALTSPSVAAGRFERLLERLDEASDWLSPIVVKEVRQIVRGREFVYSFAFSLVIGLAVAFYGAGDALSGTGTTGAWTFGALIGCLGFIAIAVVPLGAFSALRAERMEQTFELITLTALSPRRIVIGKLLAQVVKLVTLFAAMAPFIAMSFLLGGVDFVTILVSLGVLFVWSIWFCAAALVISSLVTSRAMSGLAFGALGIVALFLFVIGRPMLFFVTRSAGFTYVGGPSVSWGWTVAATTSVCLATMANLVLLAENRLSLATEDRTTALRVGFLGQFLLILAWMLSYMNRPPSTTSDVVQALGALGGLHLAIVATFAVTEDLTLSRRVARQLAQRSRWRWLLAILRPGGGRGAAYVLAQMPLLIVAGSLLDAGWLEIRWLLAICGYVCFVTGVPAFAVRWLRPHARSLHLRVAVFLLVAASLVLPDVVYYVVWRPEVFELKFSARHLFNPIRTLANWTVVEGKHWLAVPTVLGLAGLLAYLALIVMGIRANAANRTPAAPR